MVFTAIALLLAQSNAAVAVTNTTTAAVAAPTEIAQPTEDAPAEAAPERICRKRSAGNGVGLVGANKVRTVCKTRAEWAANGAPAR